MKLEEEMTYHFEIPVKCGFQKLLHRVSFFIDRFSQGQHIWLLRNGRKKCFYLLGEVMKALTKRKRFLHFEKQSKDTEYPLNLKVYKSMGSSHLYGYCSYLSYIETT